jgi:ribosomal protein L37AE/L43A
MPHKTEPLVPPTLVAQCPSCGQTTTFTFIGFQHWPPRVAQLMGKGKTTLWQCGNCLTTISNVDEKPNE